VVSSSTELRARAAARRLAFAAVWGGLALCVASQAAAQALPPVPVPPENPITEPKRVLGKILFWEEQLSSDDTVACGTCHLPERAGADPRPALHPGASSGGGDDVAGSPGVVRRDGNGLPVEDPVFGFGPQVTPRAAPSFFGSLYASETFWDGRAADAFQDPLSSALLIPGGGALESQALAPILSPVEMAREGRSWADVTGKLGVIRPLALAADLPPDVAAALTGGARYPGLFQAAFGDPAITPARIAFALATYERTLLADQTPWDLFVAGDPDALTPSQQQGWQVFQGLACATCHTPPQFTNDQFTAIGVRPASEDPGRGGVTGNPLHDGLFKTPTLRNTGVKPTFMHNGRIASVSAAVIFYLPTELHFSTNLDPRMPVDIPPADRAPLVDFIENGLTDPRVAAGSFPFDRPTLASELPAPLPALPAAWLPALALALAAAAALHRGRARAQ
jgi:cytochrome c peroxidase